MFFKLKDSVLFRKIKGYVYLTILIYGKTFDTCNEAQQLKLKIEREGSSSNFARDDVSVDHFVRDNVLSDDFLQSIHVEVASICNERCVHCYIPHKEKNKIIDSDLFFKIVEDERDAYRQ